MNTWAMRRLEDVGHDLRAAARSFRRYPVASLVAIVSLAAGIGATTVTLTLRNAIFHAPPRSYWEPSQLSRIHVDSVDRRIRPSGSAVPNALFALWSDTFGSSIAGAVPSGGERDLRTRDRTIQVPHVAATSNLFDVLGVEPLIGRRFEGSVRNAPDKPIVLSHQVWQRVFDGRPDVLGETVWLESEPHTVIGVLPQAFWYVSMDAQVWTMLDWRRLSEEGSMDTVMRRAPGTTAAMLVDRLQPGLDEFSRRLPVGQRRLHMRVSGVEGTPLGNQVAIALPYVLGVSAMLTLLIACANIATLMIAQWTAREHEIAIRASIGASRGRIVQTLLTESIALSFLAAALGLCATFALRGWVLSQDGQAAFYDLSINVRILAQTLAMTLLTAVASGLAPALYETRRLHTNPLQQIGTSEKVRQRWRHALVVLEITVTMALLVTASAMLSGYQRVRRAELGFDTAPLMAARVDHPKGVTPERILEALESLPGVAGVAASTSIPMRAAGTRDRAATDAAGSQAVSVERAQITANFFDVLGVAMRAGRTFTPADSTAAATAVVSEALAARLYAGRHALGERVWLGSRSFQIVGIAADYASGPFRSRDDELRVFLPLDPGSTAQQRVDVVLRAASDPAPLVQAVRRRIRDSGLGTVAAGPTLDQVIRVAGQEILAGTAPLFPLISIGTLLTAAGIYGVLAFALTRRARELAIRVAIGATGRDLARLVAVHMLRLIAFGSGLGLALTLALAAALRSAGGAGSIFDPPLQAFLGPLMLVAAIGALTTAVPARRASRVDPAVLLRTS